MTEQLIELAAQRLGARPASAVEARETLMWLAAFERVPLAQLIAKLTESTPAL